MEIKKILFISFFSMAVLNIAHPVTPLLINTIDLPSYTFGVLYSTMAIAQFIMSPIFGSLSDSKGRKKLLIIGIVGYGIGQLGFGFSSNLSLILFFRFVAGSFSVAFLTSVVAYISDVSTKEQRVKYMSYNAGLTSIGASFGFLIGGFFGEFGYKYSFFVQFVLSLVLAILIKLMIKETISEQKQFKLNLNHLKLTKKSIDLKTTLGVMMIIVVLVTFSQTSYNSTINYYVESVLNLPTTINGMVMAFAGILALISNLVLNPYLSKKFSENKIILFMMFVGGISIILSSVTNNLVVSVLFLSIFIISISTITPLLQSIISKLAKNNYGEVMGIQGSFKALGMVSGSLVSGFIFDIGNKLPFVFSGVSCVLAFFVLYIKTLKIKN